jgi:hypothetical protein
VENPLINVFSFGALSALSRYTKASDCIGIDDSTSYRHEAGEFINSGQGSEENTDSGLI